MSTKQHWELLPVTGDTRFDHHILRLNALGSFYFFAKFVLNKTRLSDKLHRPIAERLESARFSYLLEFPRDHFKTTLTTESLPIWWALPFTKDDEAAMRDLGYDDEWIAWMKWAHNPNIRILIVSEAGHNAYRLGLRIDNIFNNCETFRALFPEILPTEKCIWNTESKHIKRHGYYPHGEGTFDFIGVGGAIQSRHYDRIIEDDLVGKDAMKSELVMDDTIDYHRLLEGVFDGPDHTNLVVGNRWSPYDLNNWIRENEPSFVVESHSALGGCCDAHPVGVPIFPEEWTVERLEQVRRKEGPVYFSHQFLNQALMAEEIVFKPEWLRYYSPKAEPFIQKMVQDGKIAEVEVGRMLFAHEVREGEVIKDVPASRLTRSMIVDPNHSGEGGRCRHAIIVVGVDPDTDRLYLMDLWAQSMPFDDLTANIYRMAERWKLNEFWLETVAAQKILKYHLEYRNKIEKRTLRIRELKTDRVKNAKWTRIDSLSPLFEQGRIHVRRDQSAFLDEYYRYSHSTKYTVDILDCLGYALQTWTATDSKALMQQRNERRDRITARRTITGY